LFSCITEKGDYRLFAYHILSDSIQAEGQLPIDSVGQVIYARDNRLILRIKNTGEWGKGSISIYDIKDNWQLDPLLLNYQPEEFEVSGGKCFDQDIYIHTYDGPVYKVDLLSDPTQPKILASSNELGNFYKLNEKYLLEDRTYSHGVHDIETLTRVGDISLEELESYYKIWEAWNNLIFVTEQYHNCTTLFIYDVSDIAYPQLIGNIDIQFTPIFRSFGEFFILQVDYIEENILVVHVQGGILFYDITVPAHPRHMGSFFAGSYSSNGHVKISENDGQYFIHGWSRLLKHCQYSGINAVELLFLNVEDVEHEIHTFQLLQNYPNPYNNSTKIKFYLPRAVDVTMELYNILGQKVRTIVRQWLPAGAHEINLQVDRLASAVYFYRIQAGEFYDVKKMVVLR
jgi:hypothetical protein